MESGTYLYRHVYVEVYKRKSASQGATKRPDLSSSDKELVIDYLDIVFDDPAR